MSENKAFKVHYYTSPNKTQIQVLSTSIQARFNAFPTEMKVDNDDEYSNWLVLRMLSKELEKEFPSPNVETAKAREKEMVEIMARLDQTIHDKCEAVALEIDKVSKTIETYLKGRVAEIIKFKEDALAKAQEETQQFYQAESKK